MIILLSGTSETARTLVVDKLLDVHENCHHLAPEDLRDEADWDSGGAGMEDDMGTMVAGDIAADTRGEGGNVLRYCKHV